MTDKLEKIQQELTDIDEKLCEIADDVSEIADKKGKGKGKGKPIGGILEPVKVGEGKTPRVTITGTCDGKTTTISKTNGQSDTLMYPKNVGTCGNLTITCLDSLGRRHVTSVATLAQGQSLRRYDTARNTHSIVFSCDGKGKGKVCKIEFDR